MSDIPFHRTQMGQHFFEATVPSLVRELARLNTNLERLACTLDRDAPPRPEPTTSPTKEDP